MGSLREEEEPGQQKQLPFPFPEDDGAEPLPRKGMSQMGIVGCGSNEGDGVSGWYEVEDGTGPVNG